MTPGELRAEHRKRRDRVVVLAVSGLALATVMATTAVLVTLAARWQPVAGTPVEQFTAVNVGVAGLATVAAGVLVVAANRPRRRVRTPRPAACLANNPSKEVA